MIGLLTRQEQAVIFFLCVLLLGGLLMRHVQKMYSWRKVMLAVESDMGKCNANIADEAYLESIPGIGRTIAKRIIAQRSSQGKFENIEDLKKIKGVTPYRYKQLHDYLYVHRP